MSIPADEQAFLSAIAAEPDDLDVRRVYADWLEDRGDPLAELIRLDVQRSTESPLDAAYWEIRQRYREVRATIPDERRRPLGLGDGYQPMLSRRPQDHVGCWRLMDRFIDAWFGEPGPETFGKPVVLPFYGARLSAPETFSQAEVALAEERLKLRLPPAWKEICHLPTILPYLGNPFLPPAEWSLDRDDRLLTIGSRPGFLVGFRRATVEEDEDPALWEVADESGRLYKISRRLSTWLVERLILEAVNRAPAAAYLWSWQAPELQRALQPTWIENVLENDDLLNRNKTVAIRHPQAVNVFTGNLLETILKDLRLRQDQFPEGHPHRALFP